MLYRLNRLFHPQSKRTLVVAIDHALFNNAAFLAGIENMQTVVQTLAESNPDAMLLSPGEAVHLQRVPGRNKPALMLRADTANFYNDVLPSSKLFCEAYESVVEMAVRLDAACILLNLLQVDDHPEMLNQCVRNILKAKNTCDRYGMPMGVEPLSFKKTNDGGMVGDLNPARVVTLARMAAELGADLIKTDSTDPEEEFHRVIEAASGVPVTVRGGGRATDKEILEHTEKLVKQNVAGLIFGRNIIQHSDPMGMTRALQAVLHENQTASAAMSHIRTEAAAGAR